MRKAGGDKGGKDVNYLLSALKKSAPDKCFTKGDKRNAEEEEDDAQVEEDAAGDEEAPDASALVSFGHGASNWHAQNPNKKSLKMNAVHVVSYIRYPKRWQRLFNTQRIMKSNVVPRLTLVPIPFVAAKHFV
jgi:hypothetical protein